MRFCSVGLKMIPSTNPPPSMRTFLQVYGSEAAASAGDLLVATCATTTSAPATTVAAITPARLLRRMYGFLSGQARFAPPRTAGLDWGTDHRPPRRARALARHADIRNCLRLPASAPERESHSRVTLVNSWESQRTVSRVAAGSGRAEEALAGLLDPLDLGAEEP